MRRTWQRAAGGDALRACVIRARTLLIDVTESGIATLVSLMHSEKAYCSPERATPLSAPPLSAPAHTCMGTPTRASERAPPASTRASAGAASTDASHMAARCGRRCAAGMRDGSTHCPNRRHRVRNRHTRERGAPSEDSLQPRARRTALSASAHMCTRAHTRASECAPAALTQASAGAASTDASHMAARCGRRCAAGMRDGSTHFANRRHRVANRHARERRALSEGHLQPRARHR
jgi:hypothetical protein